MERLFEQHRSKIGVIDWSGAARDAAYYRATTNIGVVQRHGQVQREAAKIVENGSYDIQSAQRKALEAITEAEADGFRVSENLSVTDTRRVDLATMAARYTAAAEHVENIQWTARQLLQADNLVGQRLHDKAAELNGIRFDGAPKESAVLAAGLKRNPAERQPLSDERRRALEYADQWAGNADDPHRGNPDYENFGDGGGDCTNFASQVMRAGGFSDVGDGLDDWHRGDADDWYYNNGLHVPGNDRSNTWSVAQANRDFITQSGRGDVVGTSPMPTRAALDPLAPSKAGLVPGDLIYYHDSNGNINHTAVYVGQEMVNGRLVDVVDQHANGNNNFHNDWMPDGTDFIGGESTAEFVHLTYPGE